MKSLPVISVCLLLQLFVSQIHTTLTIHLLFARKVTENSLETRKMKKKMKKVGVLLSFSVR